MIVKTLELENIRSYTNEIIEFETGINFLQGDIGSGKSTILLAIEFALLGFKRGDLEGYHLLRKGERTGSVKLVLFDTRNNIEVEILRNIKKGKTVDTISQENGYIRVNDNLEELSPQEINFRVFEILNFPKEFITKDKNLVYRFTTYTPQENLKEILFSETEKRLEIIRKLFNIDKYKQLKDAILIYLNKSRDEKKELEIKLESSNNIEVEIKNLEKECNEINEKLKALIPKKELVVNNLEKINTNLVKREELLEKSTENRNKIEKNLTIINEIKNNLINYRDDLEKKSIIMNKLKTGDILSKKKNVEKKLKELKDKEDILKLEEKKIIDKILEIKSIEDLSKKLESVKLNIENKEKYIKEIKKDFDIVLTKCEIKDLENEIKKIKSKSNEIESIEKKIIKIEEKEIELKIELETLNKSINEKNHLNSKITHLKSCPTCLQEISIDHLNNINKQFKDEKEKYKEIIKELEKEINLQILKKKDLIFIKEDLNKKSLIIVEKETNLENLKYRLKQEEKKQDEIKQIQNEVKELIKEISNKELNNKLKELSNLKLFENKKDEFNLIKEEINKEKTNLLININEIENQLENSKSLQDEIKFLEEKIVKSKENISKEEPFKEKLTEIINNISNLKNSLKELKEKNEEYLSKDRIIDNRITELKTQYNEKKINLDKFTKNIAELKELEIRYKKLLHYQNFLSNELTQISSNIESILFTKFYVEFNESFEKYFKDLIEDNEIEVRLDEEFNPVIEQNGYDIDIKNLSGGEKSSLAIAYRLGLKNIIESNLKFEQILNLLILDEPTDGFSNEQIDRLGNILKESKIEQIILVSHDEKIESISDKIIKIEKTNHISSVNT